MKKVRKISISRGGLKIDKFDIDNETIALVIIKDKENAGKMKDVYEKRLKKQGIIIKHQKDIHYKKPFWKFWGMNDYSIAVYKICNGLI